MEESLPVEEPAEEAVEESAEEPAEEAAEEEETAEESVSQVMFASVDGSSEEIEGYWVKSGDYWYFYTVGGYLITDTWLTFNEGTSYEKTYLLDSKGRMVTGWYSEAVLTESGIVEVWYYFDANGVQQFGWEKVNGQWYYLDPEYGDMYCGGVIDISGNGDMYWFANSGAMKTGWYKESWQDEETGEIVTEWAYFTSYGAACDEWLKIGGKWYYFDENYRMQTGWLYLDGEVVQDEEGFEYYDGDTYYLDENGAMVTGWYCEVYTYEDGESVTAWYYFDTSGVMQTGWEKINGKWYYLDPYYGVMCTGLWPLGGEWVETNEGAYYTGNWYYMNEQTGAMVTGWMKLDGVWYYFDSTGAMVFNDWVYDGSNWYYIDENGTYLTGAWEIKEKTYYFTSSGAMHTGWKYLDGGWRYFGSSGAMVINGWVDDDGEWYYMQNGSMIKNSWIRTSTGFYYFKADGTMACNEMLYLQDPTAYGTLKRNYYFDSNGNAKHYDF